MNTVFKNPPEDASNILYIAEFTSPQLLSVPEDFCERLIGLQSLSQISIPSGQHRIITVWTSSAHFQAAQPTLVSELTGSSLSWQGYQSAFRSPKRRRTVKEWVRVSYLYIVSAVALLGALSALANHYRSLFAAPEIEFVSAQQSPIHLTADAESEAIRFSAYNIGDYDTRITIDKVILTNTQNSKSLILERDYSKSPLIVPVLGVGDREIINITVIPKLIDKSRSLDKYLLEISGQTKSGLMRRIKPFEKSVEIKVWKSIHIESPRLLEDKTWEAKKSDNNAQCIIKISTGEAFPDGINITNDLSRVPHVLFHSATGKVDERYFVPADIQEEGKEHAQLKWRTDSLGPYRDYYFKLQLLSNVFKTKKDWEAICKTIKTVHRVNDDI